MNNPPRDTLLIISGPDLEKPQQLPQSEVGAVLKLFSKNKSCMEYEPQAERPYGALGAK